MKNLRWADKYKLQRIAGQLSLQHQVAVFEFNGNWKGICMVGIGKDKALHLMSRSPRTLLGLYKVTSTQGTQEIIQIIIKDLESTGCITFKKRGVEA